MLSWNSRPCGWQSSTLSHVITVYSSSGWSQTMSFVSTDLSQTPPSRANYQILTFHDQMRLVNIYLNTCLHLWLKRMGRIKMSLKCSSETGDVWQDHLVSLALFILTFGVLAVWLEQQVFSSQLESQVEHGVAPDIRPVQQLGLGITQELVS